MAAGRHHRQDAAHGVRRPHQAPADRRRHRRDRRAARRRHLDGAVRRRHLERRQPRAAVPLGAGRRGEARPAHASEAGILIQPMSICYTGHHGIPMGRQHRPLVAWYGDLDFMPHIKALIARGAVDAVVSYRRAGPGRRRRRPQGHDQNAGRRGARVTAAAARPPRPAQAGAAAGRLKIATKSTIWIGATNRGPAVRLAARFARNGMSKPRKVHVKSFGCQMNVYDSASHGGHAGARRLRRDRDAPEDADLVILNTCHIREKAAEKVYSEIGRIRVHQGRSRGARPRHADRGRRLRGAGRRRGDHCAAPARRPRGRLAELSPPARARRARRSGEKVVDTEFPVEDKFDALAEPRARGHSQRAASPPSSPCRKAATSSAPSASCPIRAAPKFRARSRRSSPKSSGWPHAGVREVTLIGQNVNAYHGADEDGAPGARHIAAPARASSRHRAPALHHQPSARHERRSHRRACANSTR